MVNSKEKIMMFIFMFITVNITLPFLVYGDAGPPDVISVNSLEEAENLMPVSGVIDSISMDQGELVLSDSHYLIAPRIKFFSGKSRPESPERFVVGVWVGAYLDEMSRVKSLHLINPPGGHNKVPQKQKARQSDTGKKGGFYLDNGVYRN